MYYNITLNLQYELNYAVEYKWSKNGLCVNTKTNRIINSVTKDRCEGYYIRGKFRSKKYLRSQLQKIKNKNNLPF